MDNQSSPVQILSPTIPNSWCPSGDWADIFNSYNQLYLNNSTVNIPYLNEVTPQQIQTIQQNILTIQNQLDSVNSQKGTVTLTAATTSGTPVTTNVAVTLPQAINSANYNISGYFVVPSSSFTDTATATWGVITGTITTTGFSLWFSNANKQITSFTWQVSNLASL